MLNGKSNYMIFRYLWWLLFLYDIMDSVYLPDVTAFVKGENVSGMFF